MLGKKPTSSYLDARVQPQLSSPLKIISALGGACLFFSVPPHQAGVFKLSAVYDSKLICTSIYYKSFIACLQTQLVRPR